MLQVKRSLHAESPRPAAGRVRFVAHRGDVRDGAVRGRPPAPRPGDGASRPRHGTAVRRCCTVRLVLPGGRPGSPAGAPLVPRRRRPGRGRGGGRDAWGSPRAPRPTGSSPAPSSAAPGPGSRPPPWWACWTAPSRSGLTGASQAVVNAGTSLGVIGTGVLATTVAAPVVAWSVMAVLCLVSAMAVVTLSRGARSPDPAPPRGDHRLPALTWPILSALGAGAISSAAWTYGPTVVVAREALPADRIGLLWAALGLGGLAGALVHRPVARWGPGRAFLVCTALLVAGSILVLAPVLAGAWWPTARRRRLRRGLHVPEWRPDPLGSSPRRGARRRDHGVALHRARRRSGRWREAPGEPVHVSTGSRPTPETARKRRTPTRGRGSAPGSRPPSGR